MGHLPTCRVCGAACQLARAARPLCTGCHHAIYARYDPAVEDVVYAADGNGSAYEVISVAESAAFRKIVRVRPRAGGPDVIRPATHFAPTPEGRPA